MAVPVRTASPADNRDPDTKIPRAVREANERADNMYNGADAAAGDPSSPPAPETPPPPAAVPSEPPQEEQGSWEHRYKTLQGRAEADRKRAREAIDQLTSRVDQLSRQQATKPQPPAPGKPLQITQDEFNDYGENFIDMVQRIAQHTVDGRVAPLAQEVGRTQREISIQQNQSMHQKMEALFPDWSRMNGDPRFIEWTELPDPYSGAIRGALMQEAWNAGDARRVCAFFQGFLSEEAALNPAGGGRPQAPAPAAPNGAPAPAPPLSLERLAAPGGARSASHMPAEKQMYSTEDITRFYTEVAAGKWRHREQERAAVDQDIHRAQHEGRIILNPRRFTPPDPPKGMTR